MKIKLSTKIIGIVILLSLALLITLSTVHIKDYSENLQDFYIERAKATAHSLNAWIEDQKDIQDKDKLLLSIQKYMWLDADIISISFNTFQQGKLITYVSDDQSEVNKIPDPDNNQAYIKDILINKIMEDNDERVLRIITPVHISGQKVGTYQIDFTLEVIDNEIRKHIEIAIMMSIIITASFAFIIFFFLRQVVIRPIERINMGLHSIKEGRFDYVVKVKSKDEIGNLADSFDKMRKELLKTKAELEKHSRTLERKVRERTRELQEKNEELEKFNKLAVGRELKMIGLKKELKKFKKK